MLNTATINALIIYNRLQKDRGQQEINRKNFIIKLAENLIFSWAEKWMLFYGMQKSKQNSIKDVYIYIPHLQPDQIRVQTQ